MTTAHRVAPGHRAWTSTTSTTSAASTAFDTPYTGRHRRTSTRGLGLLRMFYRGKHRRR